MTGPGQPTASLPKHAAPERTPPEIDCCTKDDVYITLCDIAKYVKEIGTAAPSCDKADKELICCHGKEPVKCRKPKNDCRDSEDGRCTPERCRGGLAMP